MCKCNLNVDSQITKSVQMQSGVLASKSETFQNLSVQSASIYMSFSAIDHCMKKSIGNSATL